MSRNIFPFQTLYFVNDFYSTGFKLLEISCKMLRNINHFVSDFGKFVLVGWLNSVIPIYSSVFSSAAAAEFKHNFISWKDADQQKERMFILYVWTKSFLSKNFFPAHDL